MYVYLYTYIVCGRATEGCTQVRRFISFIFFHVAGFPILFFFFLGIRSRCRRIIISCGQTRLPRKVYFKHNFEKKDGIKNTRSYEKKVNNRLVYTHARSHTHTHTMQAHTSGDFTRRDVVLKIMARKQDNLVFCKKIVKLTQHCYYPSCIDSDSAFRVS